MGGVVNIGVSNVGGHYELDDRGIADAERRLPSAFVGMFLVQKTFLFSADDDQMRLRSFTMMRRGASKQLRSLT